MRAILCDRFEGIGALRMGEAAEPTPADDEVLIDVHAASVSYMDYLMTTGGYQLRPTLPYVPGTDAAGVVASVGGRVERFRPGDRVACGNWFGGFAERMVAKASKSARIPDNVDFLVGSTVLHAYLTAWYALVDRARFGSRRNSAHHRRGRRRRPGLCRSRASAWRPCHCGGRIGRESESRARRRSRACHRLFVRGRARTGEGADKRPGN